MIRDAASLSLLVAVLAVAARLLSPMAYADRWAVRTEMREARREFRRCETRQRARCGMRRELRDYDDQQDRYRGVLKGFDIEAAGMGIAAAVSKASPDDD